ncbi:hypothetical protein ABTM82_19730, partial [Acinetobacter baumannii]
ETYTMADYRNAQRLSQAAARDPKLAEAAESRRLILLPVFDASALATPVAVHRVLHQQLAAAMPLLDDLIDLLDARCGGQSPSLV